MSGYRNVGQLELRDRKWQGVRERCVRRCFMICNCPPNIVSVGKWRRYGWAGYVARMGDLQKNWNAYPQNVLRKADLIEIETFGTRMILKWIFKDHLVRGWYWNEYLRNHLVRGWYWNEYLRNHLPSGLNSGFCENWNEPWTMCWPCGYCSRSLCTQVRDLCHVVHMSRVYWLTQRTWLSLPERKLQHR